MKGKCWKRDGEDPLLTCDLARLITEVVGRGHEGSRCSFSKDGMLLNAMGVVDDNIDEALAQRWDKGICVTEGYKLGSGEHDEVDEEVLVVAQSFGGGTRIIAHGEGRGGGGRGWWRGMFTVGDDIVRGKHFF